MLKDTLKTSLYKGIEIRSNIESRAKRNLDKTENRI